MVNQVSKREVNGVFVSSHGPVKQVIDLLRLGHIVCHNLDVVCALASRNVGQGLVVVAGPQVLEGLPSFI